MGATETFAFFVQEEHKRNPSMKVLFTTTVLLAVTPFTVSAHENQSATKTVGANTCITSNGAPNHDMGRFPNRANPNSFREQTLKFCFPSNPRMADKVTAGLMTTGVSVTGVAIRPYTAGYYDPNGRRGMGREPNDWRQQAMHKPRSLGMDDQNAHVDRSGLYHYHGVSDDLSKSQTGSLIGYAPDGFEIHDGTNSQKSSYALKSGKRPSGPKGAYDGTFEEDFQYVRNAGTLDECNGRLVNGTYTYFATDRYPYFPRCFKGLVNKNFMKRQR
jgi:hypothetical protein